MQDSTAKLLDRCVVSNTWCAYSNGNGQTPHQVPPPRKAEKSPGSATAIGRTSGSWTGCGTLVGLGSAMVVGEERAVNTGCL